MKLYIACLILCFAPHAFADNYLCDLEGTDETMVFVKIKDLPIKNDEQVDYKSEYRIEFQMTELAFPSLVLTGIATESDVHFNFTSYDETVFANIFLDDANGSVTRKGQDYSLANCKLIN